MEKINLRILLDPAGSLYHDARTDEWRFQKKPASGIQPDLITSEIAAVAFDLLRTVGVDIFSTRCIRHSRKELGKSLEPLFHEGAGQYLQHCRLRPSLRENPDSEHLPPRIWNDGADALEKDARTRANFCGHLKPDFMITIDITHQEEDPGLEVVHNAVGDAAALSEFILKEVSKRTHRLVLGAREMRVDELDAVGSSTPVLILNCGSMSDLRTIKFLKQPWYRTAVATGLFAAIWKHAAVATAAEACSLP